MIEEMINKTLDYTRGNNTYLECVNNNLEYTARALSNMEYGLRSDIQDLRSDVQSAAVGMYNMGLGIRDDIQTSTAMNINAIESMSMGLTSGIRASTYAIVASQEMLNQTFKQGFNSVNNTINLGLGLVGNKIDVLSEEIYEKLDEIQKIVGNPRLTASRELYRQALISYKKGFYEEALEDCLGAVEKNKTDYISWYLLGLIYLFGAGENGNVINLDKAEEAFANAAKYIKPDIPEADEAQLMASEIFYHLGFTRLAKSNDYLIENKNDESNTKLLEAENASSMAYQLSKENLIAGYEYAKELHFLGKDDESLKLLEELIRAEKNFAIKAVNDKNFESLEKKIESLILKLRDEIVENIIQQCNYFRSMHEINQRQHKLSQIEIPSENELSEFENFYSEEFNKNDYQHLKLEICSEFNELSEKILKQKSMKFQYITVLACESVINTVRNGHFLQRKLDDVLLLLDETLKPFESIQGKDYFFVLQKNKEFKGKKNQNKLQSVSSEILSLFSDFDRGFEIFNKDIQNIWLWFDAKKEWDKTKIRLRQERVDKILNECKFIRDSWEGKLNDLKRELFGINIPDENSLKKFEMFYYTKLIQDTDVYDSFTYLIRTKADCKPLDSYSNIKENLQNGKKFLVDELDIVSSRIADVFRVFEISYNDDYFSVFRMYKKLFQMDLQNSSSYFEYSISVLNAEIEGLKKDANSMHIYIDAMKGY